VFRDVAPCGLVAVQSCAGTAATSDRTWLLECLTAFGQYVYVCMYVCMYVTSTAQGDSVRLTIVKTSVCVTRYTAERG
jgi:hypothetical protein